MMTLKRNMAALVSQANCNPIGYMVALAAIVGGVAYHFRDAVLNVIKDTVMVFAAGFLIYAVIHIAGHIVKHREAQAHKHYAELRQKVMDDKVEAAAGDPVEEAERVVSQAYQGLVPGLPKTAPDA